MLERERQQPVGRAHRQQVHDHGLERQEDRAERAQQQQVGDDEHREHEPRERAVALVDEVDAEGRRAAEQDVGRRREAGRRDVAIADPVHERDGRGLAGVAVARGADLRDAARRVDEVRLRAPPARGTRAGARTVVGHDLGIAAQRGHEPALRGDDRRVVDPVGAVRVDHHLLRRERARPERVAP